ncbi:DEAD/DEAH box helicase [Marinilabiliaceae bacterium ANBcel2]|nr:DEAD/DEAH box helicase [Marinilabiliaceae bacterium ANBcel2]
MQTFLEIGLKSELLESIEKLGFEKPTPIQAKAIPFILSSNSDLIAMAQTGTGKTAAFGLPVINKMDKNIKGIQTIILCPTRELCLQITNDLKVFAQNSSINIVPVYGGTPIYQQITAIKKDCDIIVGTPGRVNDLIKRKKMDLSSINYLILDEADEMLKMGFKDEMDAILDQTPTEKQTLLFSATIPPDINRMAGKYMNTPQTITVSKQNLTNTDITHNYCVTEPSTSYDALKRIADITPDIYSIVFCRTRHETKKIADSLMGDGYNADALHGDLSQAQRDYVMGRFRNHNLQILVATDVAARGLDVDNLTHVIHYHLPDDIENYIHRSGRTGRAGNKGISFAILAPAEQRRIPMLEKQSGQKFVHSPIPSGTDVFSKRLYNYLDKITETTPTDFDYNKIKAEVENHFKDLSREEIIEKFVTFNFNKLFNEYENSKDLNSSRKAKNGKAKGNREGKRQVVGRNFTRYSLNIGSSNDLRPDVLISLINRQTPSKKIDIGKIDIQRKVCFFEADKQHEKQLVNGFKKARFKGLPLLLETARRSTDLNRYKSSKGRARNKNKKQPAKIY